MCIHILKFGKEKTNEDAKANTDAQLIWKLEIHVYARLISLRNTLRGIKERRGEEEKGEDKKMEIRTLQWIYRDSIVMQSLTSLA